MEALLVQIFFILIFSVTTSSSKSIPNLTITQSSSENVYRDEYEKEVTDGDHLFNYNQTTDENPKNHNVDSWSIMWYLVSFGGLITFFLLISFSEVCCKKSVSDATETEEQTEETSSPPPYDLFAPPPYDSLFQEKQASLKNDKKGKKKRRKFSVYVVTLTSDNKENHSS